MEQSNKIFLGNLPFTAKEEDLVSLCEKYGSVIGVNIRKDRNTGKCKGFAFVTFEEEDNTNAAQAAIAGLNMTSMEGRQLTVNFADKRGTAASEKTKNPKAPAKNWTEWSGPGL